MRFDLVNVMSCGIILAMTFWAGGEFREYQIKTAVRSAIADIVGMG